MQLGLKRLKLRPDMPDKTLAATRKARSLLAGMPRVRIQDQLAADGFQLVKTTSPHHLARLYRRVQR